ncbi:MAG: FumA C-terminus/TtdB family hydratase beta subunit [Actinomycetota bacterium]
MPVEEREGKKYVRTPLSEEDVRALSAGDVVLISGTVYAARDAAHKRLLEMADRGEPLPFPVQGSIVYYVGPTPTRPGEVTGSAGPTTSGRMDRYTPRMLEMGMKGMIGKGSRGPGVREALREHVGVYMAALGGGGALSALSIKRSEIVAFEELGPEAVRAMEFEEFPAWVINDCEGRDYYSEAMLPWRRDEALPEEMRIVKG